jgi:hypothetical protein
MRESIKVAAIAVILIFSSIACGAVDKPKHIFIRDFCTGPLGSEIMSSFRQEIRASAGYELAASLADHGGDEVVITVYVTCTESRLPTSERVVSVGSIFGTGTCSAADSCHINSNESTLGALLCSGKSGTGCGKDLYVSMDDYMSKEGGEIFRYLSEGRKKALGR